MIKLLKWLLIILVSLVIVSSAFIFYTYFLVDYSLESLETAMAATETSADLNSPAMGHLYHNIVDDLALNEVASGDLDFKNLLMTETASRSLSESLDRNGDKRAKVYLNEIVKRKKNNQPLALQIRKFIETQLQKVFNFTGSFLRFFSKKISRGGSEKNTTIEGTRFIFLSKTQKLEKEGKYKEAIDRYRQYLKRYPESSDKGFVSISLSYVLIKDGRLREAERLLKEIQAAYSGKMEAKIASQVIARISDMDKNVQKVELLRQRRVSGVSADSQKNIDYELAVLYVSLYRFSDAEIILKKLKSSPDLIGQQSAFKLGWIYKNTRRLAEAEKVYLEVLGAKGLPPDLELGIHGELADIYYGQKNPAKALEHYKKLTEKAEEAGISGTDGVWKSLAAFEQAHIYNFDLKDKNKAREQLNLLGETFIEVEAGDNFSDDVFNISGSDLRSQAFRALGTRQFGAAYELFSRNLISNPQDSWTYAGLATVSILLGDLDEAVTQANQAFSLEPDEYTSSMMGYVYGLRREYAPAVRMYEKALQIDPKYIPAGFNLGCMNIRLREYKKALQLLLEVEKNAASVSPLLQSKIANNLGYVLWRLGQHKAAMEKFEKAVKIEPDYMIAVKNIENLQKALERTAKVQPSEESLAKVQS